MIALGTQENGNHPKREGELKKKWAANTMAAKSVLHIHNCRRKEVCFMCEACLLVRVPQSYAMYTYTSSARLICWCCFVAYFCLFVVFLACDLFFSLPIHVLEPHSMETKEKRKKKAKDGNMILLYGFVYIKWYITQKCTKTLYTSTPRSIYMLKHLNTPHHLFLLVETVEHPFFYMHVLYYC